MNREPMFLKPTEEEEQVEREGRGRKKRGRREGMMMVANVD